MTAAFAFFGGACTRGIYDNMKTAVDTVFVGKERAFNRRFLLMCSHYLVEPTACTPASGWEKGQVENQVGLIGNGSSSRGCGSQSFEELNGWLLDQLRRLRQGAPASRAQGPDGLAGPRGRAAAPGCRIAGPFDGFHAAPAAVSQDLPDHLRPQQLLGDGQGRRAPGAGSGLRRPDRHPRGGEVVAEHARCFGRGRTIYDPWHYLPVLATQARRAAQRRAVQGLVAAAGADPAAAQARRRRRSRPAVGGVLAAVLIDGLDAVEAACARPCARASTSDDVILNILARRREPPRRRRSSPRPRPWPCSHPPIADCARYDSLRGHPMQRHEMILARWAA